MLIGAALARQCCVFLIELPEQFVIARQQRLAQAEQLDFLDAVL